MVDGKHGQWLLRWRQARGWSIQTMRHKLREAAAATGDTLPGDVSLSVMIHRWEDDRSGISDRYRAHYCRAFGVPRESFGDLLPEPGAAAVTDDRAAVGDPLGPGRFGPWLRGQRHARGWSVPDLRRELRKAAARVGDQLPADRFLTGMIRRWETDQAGISERYRLYFCCAFDIDIALFGTEPASTPESPCLEESVTEWRAEDVLKGLPHVHLWPGWTELDDAVRRLGDPDHRDELCFLLGYASAMTARITIQ